MYEIDIEILKNIMNKYTGKIKIALENAIDCMERKDEVELSE